MPKLNKKKRKNIEREGLKANYILNRHKSDKFLQNERKFANGEWKFGHLKPSQVMLGSDKLIHKKFKDLQNKIENNNTPFNYRNLDERNELDNFMKEQTESYQNNKHRYYSDSDIDDEDDIFKLRRHKKRPIILKKKEINSDDYTESDSDSYDDGDKVTNVDDEYQDINDVMLNDKRDYTGIGNVDDLVASDYSDEEINSLRKLNSIDVNEIQKQIEQEHQQKNKDIARILNVSKQYETKQKRKENELYNNDDNKMDNDVDSSMSDVSDVEIKDNENSLYPKKKESNVGKGISKVNWGKKKTNYYGGDSVDKIDGDYKGEQWKTLREEEAIGIQTEIEQMGKTKREHYMDREMESLYKDVLINDDDDETKKIKRNKVNIDTKNSIEMERNTLGAWFNEDESNIERNDNDDINMNDDHNDDTNDTPNNVEEINKNIDKIKEDEMRLIKRDNPELPGILVELKSVIQDLKIVNNNRLKAIKMDFDEGIKDATLYLELLRTYAATLSFYLQLKASGKLHKNHDVFGEMIQLKECLGKLKPIYDESMDIMNSLPENWSKDIYKREQLKLKIKRQNAEESRRLENINEALLEKKLLKNAKRKERKERQRNEEIKREIIRKGEQKLHYMDLKENEEERRHINQKIFKSRGLKRYRKKGIPRTRQRQKYIKKMKLWRKRGYKPVIKNKHPDGRFEWKIPINISHSKKLD